MIVPNSHEQVYIKATLSLHFLTYIHPFHFIRLRERLSCTNSSVRQPTKEVLSDCWEIISSWEIICHYSRSTTARAILVLRRLCPTQDLICKQFLIPLSFPENISTYCLRFCKLFSIKRFMFISSFVLFYCFVHLFCFAHY